VPEATRGTVLTWVVAAVLATLAAVRLFGVVGEGSSAPPVRIDGGAGQAARSPGAARGGEKIFVHVAGAVRRPGLYRVPAAARVAEALQRAGGPLRRAQLTAVNLAAPVEDGQQVVVPTVGAVPAAGAAPGPVSSTAGGPGIAGGAKLSLAAATVEQLEELDGIGPTLAGRIIEYRDSNGGFRSVEELREVDGIGEKRFASLREAVQP
jgi:competence protein ComEA